MKILVDADACPVKTIIVSIAKELHLPVRLYTDVSHILGDGYSVVVTVDSANDSADFALVNAIEPGDIVVTQDYGLASMALAKGASCIHQNGFLYTSANIDQLLFERHIGKKMRNAGQHSKSSRIKKRTPADDLQFSAAFRSLCIQQLQKIQEQGMQK